MVSSLFREVTANFIINIWKILHYGLPLACGRGKNVTLFHSIKNDANLAV